MFLQIKKSISEVQYSLKQMMNTKAEITFRLNDFSLINSTLEDIYQAINSYRAIQHPPMLYEDNNLDLTCKVIIQWLDYANQNCISEVELFEKKQQNMLDANFIYLINIFKDNSPNELYKIIKTAFENNSSSMQKWYTWYYNKYKSYWGNLDPLHEDYEIISLRANSFHEHWEDFLWLYNKLKDYRSKQILYTVLLNWMFFMEMSNYKDRFMKCYFDLDVIKCDKDEVFVDLGTFTGDTVLDFLDYYGTSYKRIYCYDISLQNLEQARSNLSKYQNIEYRLKAISDHEGTVCFDSSLDISAYYLSENGDNKIDATTLDQDIKEKITFIKADIEGSEQKAILGCRNHIRNDKPKLAFSIYHNNEDIWKVARMIDNICPGYDFYIRYQGSLLAASEFTLLAVYGESSLIDEV